MSLLRLDFRNNIWQQKKTSKRVAAKTKIKTLRHNKNIVV